MPRFFNKSYFTIQEGEHFGHTDLSQDANFVDVTKSDKEILNLEKDRHIRRFTTLAMVNCDLLSISLRDLLKMKLEFPKVFAELF